MSIVRWEDRKSGRIVRWQDWRDGMVVRWQVGKSGRVVMWERWGSSEVARWEVPGFIRGWGMQGESKILSFVSDVNQRNEVAGCVQDILAWQGWKDSL